MARLVCGDRVFDVWIDDRTDGVWLRAREGDGPIRELRSQPRAWVERGLQSELSRRLRDGWRRVRDPAREPEVDDEPREPRLEAALAADPEDAAAALVYVLPSVPADGI
jgi:DNA-directed RNA polymerase specialized sigma24 family protein